MSLNKELNYFTFNTLDLVREINYERKIRR